MSLLIKDPQQRPSINKVLEAGVMKKPITEFLCEFYQDQEFDKNFDFLKNENPFLFEYYQLNKAISVEFT
jgi:hypothetical protein